MKINLSISPLANVLALVNLKNGSSLTDEQVTAGLAVATTENPGDNTKVTLTGVTAKGYKDTLTYFYGRYGLLGGVEPDPVNVPVLGTDSQAQIRSKIIAAYGLMASEIVINGDLDITLPTEGNPVTVEMVARNGSLLYVEDPISVELVLAP